MKLSKNKVTIMFYLPNLNGGGAEHVAVNFIRELDPEKFNIVLVLVKNIGVYKSLIPEYVTVYDLDINKVILSLFDLRKLIKVLRPDIVYSTLFRTHYILYIALLGLNFRPSIVMRSPNSPKLVIKNKQINWIQKKLLDYSYKRADIVIAQTPEMRLEIIKFHHVNADKIEILLNPIDTKLIDDKIKNIDNPFDEQYINIVAAGRLGIQKGFDILLQAFSKVIVHNSTYRLYILGEDNGDETKLKLLCKELNIQEYVQFLGFQDNPYQYFFFSDLYVLSSRWEGLPNTVIENLYLKKPIIATRCIPYMDKLIFDKNNGILVEVDNIDELSSAILNYKNINVNCQSINFSKSKIEKLFLEISK